MINLKTATLATCATIALGLGGCATFPGGNVPKATFDDIKTTDKPIVYIDVMGYSGTPKSPSALPTTVPTYQAITKQAFLESHLFKEVLFNPADKGKANLNIEVKIYENNHTGVAVLTGLIDYISLSIIPGFTYTDSTAQVTVLDNNNNVVSTSTKTDSVSHIWGAIGLLAYPFGSDAPAVVANKVVTNEVKAALKEQYSQGHLNSDASDKVAIQTH